MRVIYPFQVTGGLKKKESGIFFSERKKIERLQRYQNSDRTVTPFKRNQLTNKHIIIDVITVINGKNE